MRNLARQNIYLARIFESRTNRPARHMSALVHVPAGNAQLPAAPLAARKSRGVGGGSRDATLYVTGLSADATPAIVVELFLQCGHVRTVRLPEPALDRPRFAFVEYLDACSALYAARVLDGSVLFGNVLRVELASKREANASAGGQVFIRPLPDELDEFDLADIGSVSTAQRHVTCDRMSCVRVGVSQLREAVDAPHD